MKKKILSVIISFLLVAVSVCPMGSVKVKSAKLDDLYSDLADLEQREEELEAAKKKAESEKQSLRNKKYSVDQQLINTQTQLALIDDIIEDLEKQYEEESLKLEQSQKELDEHYDTYKERIRANYENGNVSFISVIFGSTSISDFLSRIELVREIMDYDNNLMAEMKENITTIEESQKIIEENKKKNEETQEKLSDKKKELNSQSNENQKLINSIQSDINAYEAELKEFERQVNDLNNQIKSLINPGIQYVGGTFAWPVPGYTYITSHFGPRSLKNNPYNFHQGMDISGYAITGKPVVSANDGTVILTTYTWGEGNIISVDHGGGITTQYKHLSAIYVKVGQKVSKGEKIGAVGNTGYYSTGAHLHFEVSVNGVRVDPEGYKYSGKK